MNNIHKFEPFFKEVCLKKGIEPNPVLLKQARERLGLSKNQVAKRVGITAVYYGDIENGHKPSVGAAVAAKIAEVLSC